MKSLNHSTLNSSISLLHKTHFLKLSNNTHILHFHAKNKGFKLPNTTTCTLKNPKDLKSKAKNVSKKIVLSETVPPPLKEDAGAGNGRPPEKSESKGSVFGMGSVLMKRVLKILSNLPLAIGEMFAVAALMALGMHIMFLFLFVL